MTPSRATSEGGPPSRSRTVRAKAPGKLNVSFSVGPLREDGYHCMAEFARTKREPALKAQLDAPIYAGELALCVSDVSGRCFYYRFGHI